MATLKYKTKDGEYKPLVITSPSSKIERFEKDEDGNIVLEQGGNIFTVENSDVYFSDLLDEDAIMTIISGGVYQIEDTSKVEEFIANAKGKIVVFDGIVIPYIFLYEDGFEFTYCGVNTFNDELGIWYIRYSDGEFTIDLSSQFSNYQPLLESGTNIKTINGQSILGEGNLNITAASLGIDTALKYHGVTTTSLTDGATTNPIVINGSNHTAASGCVVFYGNKEFVFDGTTWKELGDGSNHKIKQDAVNSPSASGTTTAFIDTISQDANGKITATKKNITSASTSRAGIVQLSSSTSSTSTTLAATASAVKSAYDRANAVLETAINAASDAHAAADNAYAAATTAQATANEKWTYSASTIAGVKVNNATAADSATKATQDSDGNAINTTYLKLSGGTMTGTIQLASGSFLEDTGGNGIIGVAITGSSWTGVSSGDVFGAISTPTTLRSNGNLTHYRNDKGGNYTILDSSNVGSYAVTSLSGYATQTWVQNQNYQKTDTKVSNTASASGDRFLLGISGNTSGTVTATGTHGSVKMNGGYLYALSDETLKNFEKDITIDFEELKTLPKKYFRWKDNPETLNIGTSAQSVQKLYPELVSKGDDGKLSVNYIHLSVVALAAIDKLHEENLELKERIERLESKIK